jgi:hypothetical protein
MAPPRDGGGVGARVTSRIYRHRASTAACSPCSTGPARARGVVARHCRRARVGRRVATAASGVSRARLRRRRRLCLSSWTRCAAGVEAHRLDVARDDP